MAEGTQSMQDYKRLKALFSEFTEQMRQIVASNTSEIAKLKHAFEAKMLSLGPTEEGSHLGADPLPQLERRRETSGGQGIYVAPTRQTRVDFPRFSGEDLRGWLYKCENFFELDGTPWHMRVKVAAVHLEGRALQRHLMYTQKRVTRDVLHWEEYTQALHIRFGATFFEDQMADLMSLRQTSDLEECLEAFDSLLGRVCLPEEYAISCLLAAIREDIANVVRMHRTKTLLETYALARQQNINLKYSRGRAHSYMGSASRSVGVVQKPWGNYNESLKPATAGILLTPNRQPITNKREGRTVNSKRLTITEMDEKRRKGICFWCYENFVFGHKCSNRQLHMVTIDPLEQEAAEEVNPEVLEEEIVLDSLAQLSLFALTEAIHEFRCNTMRVVGEVKRRSLNILVDSGSTHSFLDAHVAKRMGCVAESIIPLFVAVANGERLICREVCRNLMWEIQGYEFKTDLFLLRLGGCDMVLDVEWLVTLRDIIWNFQSCTMRFTQAGWEYVLQGTKENKHKEVEVNAFEKVVYKTPNATTLKTRYLVLTQFVSECQSLQLSLGNMEEEYKEIHALLQQFQGVFDETRSGDNQVTALSLFSSAEGRVRGNNERHAACGDNTTHIHRLWCW